MINKGQINRELGKFLMICSNLIKSHNKSMIEIRENVFYERELKEDSTKSKIIKFDFDFGEKLKIEVRRNFQNRKNEINENQNKIKLNY